MVLSRNRFIAIGVPVALLMAALLIALIAPEERTLGSSIRSVYIHVALTITGRIGLSIAGLLGLIVLLTGHKGAAAWMQTIGWMALAFFAAGIIASAMSARMTWGGFGLDEPRMRGALQVASITLIVQILHTWLPPSQIRLQGLLHMIPVSFLTWMVLSTELVLHPEDPIGTSNATPIQLTFGVLIALCTLAAAWMVWQQRRAT